VGALPKFFLISFQPVLDVHFKLEFWNMLESRNYVVNQFCHALVAEVDAIRIKELVFGLPAPNLTPWRVDRLEETLGGVLTLCSVTPNTSNSFMHPESGRLKQVRICIL
jgi:hypothetical protein